MVLRVNTAASSHSCNNDVSPCLNQGNLQNMDYFVPFMPTATFFWLRPTPLTICNSDMCKMLRLLTSLTLRLTYVPPGRAGQSTVSSVNVFKFSLQLSGRFILPVVTANGCITTGSGHDPRGISRVGGGHLCRFRERQTPHVSRDIISSR